MVKIDVVGSGCFVLYEEHNYRKQIGKVYSGFRLTTEIPAIGSIEYFPECEGTFKDNARAMKRSSVFKNATKIGT